MSGLTIQEWLDAHKRVVGTRRVAGNSLVVQAASITTVDQPVSFAETANFALIRCCAPLLKAREGCHLSDLLFSILQTNPHLDGFLFDLSLADTNDLSKVQHQFPPAPADPGMQVGQWCAKQQQLYSLGLNRVNGAPDL